MLKCPGPSRTVPYQSELPNTIRMVRINFNEFPRIDSRGRFVEIRLLSDRGISQLFPLHLNTYVMLCYDHYNYFTLSVQGLILDVYIRLQILTSKVGPDTERVIYLRFITENMRSVSCHVNVNIMGVLINLGVSCF